MTEIVKQEGGTSPVWMRMVVLLWSHRKFILQTTLLVGVLSMAVSWFLLDNWYKSTASLLPPHRQSSPLDLIGGNLGSSLKDLNIGKLTGTLNSPSTPYSYIGILESRNLRERLVHDFNLITIYEISDSSLEKTLKELDDHIKNEVEDNGTISISVEDKDPHRAQAMANAAVTYLNEVTSMLNEEEARANSKFIEARYEKNLTALKTVEDSLKKFQAKYKLYQLPEQLQAEVTALSQLRLQELIAETKYRGLAQVMGDNAVETRLARSTYEEIKKRSDQLEFGTGGQTSNVFVPFNVLPKVGMEYLRLYRNFEIQSKLQALLMPIYEQAQLDESKSIPPLLTLDSPVVPEKKSRPKRAIIVLVSMVSALLLLGTGIVFFDRMPALRQSFRREEEALKNKL